VANANVEAANIKCNMMSGSSFDFNFYTMDTTDLSTVTITPKALTYIDKYEYAAKSFTFKCSGSLSPDKTALESGDFIKV